MTLKPESKDNQPSVQQALIDITSEHCLSQIHSTPTRGKNLLDLVFTSNKSLVKSSINVPGISDHDMIVTDTYVKATISKKRPQKCYLYSKANWNELKQQASQLSNDICQLEKEGLSLEDLWIIFRDRLLKITDSCIPHKTSTAKRSLPWINRDIKAMLRRKCKLYKKAKEKNEWSKFRKFQKICRQTIKEAENKHINEAIIEGFNNKNPKPFWNYIKAKKHDTIGVAPLKSNGELVSDSVGKANALINQFVSVFTKDPNPVTLPPVNNKPTTGVHNIKVDRNGVEKLLERINPNKAMGPDRIPNLVLKNCAHDLSMGIQCLFQKSLDTGSLPSDWLDANITPVFKKGDRHQPENYRPVSLTSVTGKLLEHIVCKHVMNHLETNKILTTLNHGFRTGYSCETQLITTLNDLSKAFDRDLQTDMAILDFSKAFDTVPHHKLLHKLNEYGIQGALHDWFKSFLTCRKMQVVVDGEVSSSAYVASGVPQGTVLGPILFLCHINDLPECVKSQVRLFADDCLLYRQIKSPDDHLLLQEDLKNLEDWAAKWGMRFNAKKCYIMSIRAKSHHYYQLGGQILQQVKQNPYLGVLLSEDLKWEPHISQISSKASSTLGFIRRNLKSCPTECKKLAYISLVRSTLEYACSSWDPHYQKDIEKLERIQRKAVRFIFNDYTSKDDGFITGKLKELNLTSLQERRRAIRLTLFYKAANGQVPAIDLNKYLEPVKNIRLRHPPSKFHDYVTPNAIENSTQNNSKCFQLIASNTEQYKNSFFPRTVIEWNKLSESQISAPSTAVFSARLIQKD